MICSVITDRQIKATSYMQCFSSYYCASNYSKMYRLRTLTCVYLSDIYVSQVRILGRLSICGLWVGPGGWLVWKVLDDLQDGGHPKGKGLEGRDQWAQQSTGSTCAVSMMVFGGLTSFLEAEFSDSVPQENQGELVNFYVLASEIPVQGLPWWSSG